MTLPWPEMRSSLRPGETVREMLDYIAWIAQDLQLLGAHGPSEVGPWRRQVGVAYRALVNPMIPGYGDPYPPDVPPARSPGLWPDVAAHDLPGMTIRHQLVVIGMLADQSRHGVGVRARPELLQDLEMRIARARTALDHGPGRPMPAAARTEPSKSLIEAAHAEEKAVRDHARRLARRERGPKRATKPTGGARKAAPPKKAAAGAKAKAPAPRSRTKSAAPTQARSHAKRARTARRR